MSYRMKFKVLRKKTDAAQHPYIESRRCMMIIVDVRIFNVKGIHIFHFLLFYSNIGSNYVECESMKRITYAHVSWNVSFFFSFPILEKNEI